MEGENDIENNAQIETAAQQAVKEDDAAKSAQESEKDSLQNPELTRHEAVARAVEEHRAKEEKREERPARKKEYSIDPRTKEAKEVKTAGPDAEQIKAPGEWTKEEQEDFRSLSRKQQEATIRVYQSRVNKMSELHKKLEEVKWADDFAKEMSVFLQSRGDRNPRETMINALKFANQFGGPDADEATTRRCAAEYLRAKGVTVPKELEIGDGDGTTNPEITPLQKQIVELQGRLDAQESAAINSAKMQVWQTFASSKNGAGAPKYSDINDTESGKALARLIGTLVTGRTELSRQFINSVQSRIPNLTPIALYEEAYKYGGGRIDNTESTARIQDPQKHIRNSNRAASSVPGRGVSKSDSPARKLSRKDALKLAVSEWRDANLD